jgi:hypothetical protein
LVSALAATAGAALALAPMAVSLDAVASFNTGAGCPGSGWPSTVSSIQRTTLPSE